jgi:hypothetical protein
VNQSTTFAEALRLELTRRNLDTLDRQFSEARNAALAALLQAEALLERIASERRADCVRRGEPRNAMSRAIEAAESRIRQKTLADLYQEIVDRARRVVLRSR